jgi:hypothetical protein
VLGWLVELLRAPLAPSSPVVAVETTSGMHQAWVSELERQVAQQRLHDQLNRLCPGLSAPVGHGQPRPQTQARGPDRPGRAGTLRYRSSFRADGAGR